MIRDTSNGQIRWSRISTESSKFNKAEDDIGFGDEDGDNAEVTKTDGFQGEFMDEAFVIPKG